MKELSWNELKKQGSDHYKTDGGIEPIDLYRDAGMFRHFAICSIIKVKLCLLLSQCAIHF